MTPRLRARSLERSFRIGGSQIPVLRGIDLDIVAGESVFLCGASGAGKTTLLYTLAGLETPESGTVEFEGQSLYSLSGNALARLRNQHMGFVFQSYFLLPELTALENALVPAMIRGTSAQARAMELLERVGLRDRMQHLPAELSGGEQQRVAIARSLINDPSILFADEPTGNLDSKNGEVIMALLLDLARDGGRTLVVVTHDDHLAQRGDRTVRIVDGRLDSH
jgi:putative ABC transport system ATP-binding protein/lipoprotein-releasing system ATP-binding protein